MDEKTDFNDGFVQNNELVDEKTKKDDDDIDRALQTSIYNKTKSVELTVEQQLKMVEMASNGASIGSICKSVNLKVYELSSLLRCNPLFLRIWMRVRDLGFETLADDLLDIADRTPDVQRARLKSENIKWLLAKKKPETYGDRLKVDVEVVDIRGALELARSRASVPVSYQIKEEDAESPTNTSGCDGGDTDNVSVDNIFS